MPTRTEQCPPELFLEHNGVQVFHAYKDDDFDQGSMDYWFTADDCSDEDHFDIRDFETEIKLTPGIPYAWMNNPEYRKATSEQRKHWQDEWNVWNYAGFDAARKAVLIEAIEKGLIKNPN